MKLTGMNVEDYIAELASDSPAPGGGSASALCGAQGAALTAMVAGLTIGKKKYEEHEALCMDVKTKATALEVEMLSLINRDTQAYMQLTDAFKLPKETPEDKKARSAAIQAGTLAATQVPYDTMARSLEVIRLTRQLVGHSNTNAASDLGVAALNLMSCCDGAWLNVLINLGGLKDEEAVSCFRQGGQEIQQQVAALGKEIYQMIADSIAQG